MFQKKLSTKICNGLLADKKEGNAARLALGSELAQLVGTPDPNHYSSAREYRQALVGWEEKTPRQHPPAIVSADSSGGGRIVVCLSCFEVTLSLGEEEGASRDGRLSTHICD